MAKSMHLTQEYLRSILDYEPITGAFTWKPRPDRSPQWNGRFAGKKTGNPNEHGALRIGIDGELYYAHQLAWIYMTGENPAPLTIDHIDCNPSNNAWQNLRLATKSEQAANRRKRTDNKSGYKGVYFMPNVGKWSAQTRVDGKLIYLGLFDSPEKAYLAYLDEARKRFGAYHRVT
jgi:hypothetical protein